MMEKNLRVGVIGLDTSRVERVAKVLNDETNEHHIPGTSYE